MKKLVSVFLGLIIVVLVAAGGAYVWASSSADALKARTLTAHEVDFPIPFPLTPEEIAALETKPGEPAEPAEGGEEAEAEDERDAEKAEGEEGEAPSEVDVDALAQERAIERGRHLVQARYGCVECHGKNMAGGTMVDDPAIGTFGGPNLTLGRGGKTKNYTAKDWDLAVRHGILPGGRPSIMPAEDYQLMSDRELSDIITYIRTFDPVDNEVPAPTLGPVGTFLVATGKLGFAYDHIKDHTGDHPAVPPKTENTVDFGRHLAGVCTGCHRANLQGGPMPFGPPDWAPAANLTPHESGLAGWTYEQFVQAMRQGKRPDGTTLREPMSLMLPYAQKMADVELQAIWTYLQSIPATPTGT